MLRSINDEWNKCKHEIYVASPKSAIRIVEILNNSLEELEFLAGEANNRNASVVQLNKKWQSHWGIRSRTGRRKIKILHFQSYYRDFQPFSIWSWTWLLIQE